MKIIGIMIASLILTGCSVASIHDLQPVSREDASEVSKSRYATKPPKNGPLVVAVYSFNDLTGQRQPTSGSASLSMAVTQGADSYVVNGLKSYSGGRWFRVVERSGIDNLVKERQIIRSSRIGNDDAANSPLPPMMYAGIIIEGGIIGYDSDIISGGQGLRVFGLGVSEQYTKHNVTVSMRVVSVATSEVLLSVLVEKELLSKGINSTTFKFFDMDTQTLEIEGGENRNEASSRAVQYTIEKAIHTIVRDGVRKQIW